MKSISAPQMPGVLLDGDPILPFGLPAPKLKTLGEHATPLLAGPSERRRL
jgi:hypothetical protein